MKGGPLPDQTTPDSPLRRFARREPLITRAAVSAAALLLAAAATRWAGVELDTDATVAVLLGWLGLTGAVIREGVYSPATVDRERQRAADEALLGAPIGTATIYQVDGTAAESEWERVIPPAPDTALFPPPEPYGGAHGQASEQPR